MNYEQEIAEYLSKGETGTTFELGHRFLEWVLLKLFNRTEMDLMNDDASDGVAFTDGTKDFGIDCSFLDGDTLYIIQGKERKQHNHDNIPAFEANISAFLKLENARSIREKLRPIFSFVQSDEVREIKIYYITNNYLDNEFRDYHYKDTCAEFNEEYSRLLDKNVTWEIVGYEKYPSIRTGILLELPGAAKKAQSTLILARYFENRDSTTVVAEIPLKELARLVRANLQYIFASNIRNYKGMNAINKRIKETYEEHPKDFWYFNNGITIVCEDYTLDRDRGNIVIHAPQIVNGCQTATTIYKCWEASGAYEKDNIDGTILIKIIKDAKQKRRRNITRFTNSQTAVTGKDFYALEDFHVVLQKSFKDMGYFYEIQSDSVKAKRITAVQYRGSEKYQHFFDADFRKRNAINAKAVTQTYIAALMRMPAKARNIGQFMPGCDRYDEVFNENSPTDPKFYLLPFGCWYYFAKVFKLPDNIIIDKDKWKNSLLIAVFTFFRLIDKAYFREETVDYISDIFIEKCDEKMSDVDCFRKLAFTTYNILKDFYNDSTIKKIISDNFPKFVKGTFEANSQVIEILDDKIEARKDDVFE